MEENIVDKSNQLETKCVSCGGTLHYAQGTSMMTCQYCGASNEFEVPVHHAEELDFHAYVQSVMSNPDATEKISTIKCDACGSTTNFDPKIVSDSCSFCGSPLAVKEGSTNQIKPKSMLPFAIDKNKGFEEFKKWVNSRWFAPNDLKKATRNTESLNGVYIPYWTFDAGTYTYYTGMRGIHRQERYTTTVNGKEQTMYRTVTDWYPCAGYVSHDFDDVLVLASDSLPKTYTEALEPWDLNNLAGFDHKFMSGFKAESYAVDLEAGFEIAKEKMESRINMLVRQDIGGNAQQILTKDITHSNVTFKHILLPVYISAFRYNGRVYRFLVNGRTGEVQGERPYSTLKIVFFILMLIAVIAGIVMLVMHFKK
jgi:ribosomal protein S27E